MAGIKGANAKFGEAMQHYTTRMPATQIEQLKSIAQKEGVGHTELSRKILTDYLKSKSA